MTRVVVIGGEQPLWVGIVSMLGKESNLDLINLPLDDGEALLSKVNELKPAVIILDEKYSSVDPSLILGLQKIFSELRVVVISSRENRLWIYDKRHILVSDLGDFISVVQNG